MRTAIEIVDGMMYDVIGIVYVHGNHEVRRIVEAENVVMAISMLKMMVQMLMMMMMMLVSMLLLMVMWRILMLVLMSMSLMHAVLLMAVENVNMIYNVV